MKVKRAILFFVFLLGLAVLIVFKEGTVNIEELPQVSTHKEQAEVKDVEAQETFVQSFEYYPIDKKTEDRISGISWRQGSPVEIDDLRLVEVTYWGFDEKPHIGELIVNKALAKDIVEIFEELYSVKFPIEKIKLIDEYNAEDSKSMNDNNTSAFCYRDIEGKPGKISQHSYGVAVDINPVQNPYVYKDKVSPLEGNNYIDRSRYAKGMIVKDDAVYKAFISRGWTWGGDWKSEKDYQHFQKKINLDK